MARNSLPPLEDDFTRALLRSAEGDEPSHAAYAKAAAALGVGVGLGVSASLPAPAVLATGAAGLAGAARWSGSTLARLAAFGVSGALLVGAGALWLRSSQQAASAHQGRAPAARAVAAPTLKALAIPSPGAAVPGKVDSAPAAGPAAAAELAPAADAPTVASSSSSGAGAHRAPRSQRAAARSSLPEQVQSLDRARVALSSGDAGTALREIAHYRATWPKGVFLTEASVLEIEALAARGERSLAATRAAAFVAAHPDSPQAGRLRTLIPAEKP